MMGKKPNLPGNPKETNTNAAIVANERGQLNFLKIGNFMANVKPPEWLIDNVLEKNTMAVMFGDPGSFKSFMAIAWALSVATGTPWNGNKVEQGPVIIINGEGHNGFIRRIKAWSVKTGVDLSDTPLFVSNMAIQVLNDHSFKMAKDNITELVKECGKPALVVIDTLARNFGPGDENSTQDMTNFVARLDSMLGNEVTKLIVHHTGHNAKGRGRGSMVLPAAADTQYAMKVVNSNCQLDCIKMKDGERFKTMAFNPEVVVFGDDINNQMTSVFLVGTNEIVRPETPISKQMEEAMELLREMEKTCRTYQTEYADWRSACVSQKIYQRQSFSRASATMLDKGLIERSGIYVWLSQPVAVCRTVSQLHE